MPEEGRQIMYNNWKHSYTQRSDYDAASIGEEGGLRVNHLSKMLGWPKQNKINVHVHLCYRQSAA